MCCGGAHPCRSRKPKFMYYLFIYLYTHYLTLRWYSSLQIAKAQIWDILKNQCTSTFIIQIVLRTFQNLCTLQIAKAQIWSKVARRIRSFAPRLTWHNIIIIIIIKRSPNLEQCRPSHSKLCSQTHLQKEIVIYIYTYNIRMYIYNTYNMRVAWAALCSQTPLAQKK